VATLETNRTIDLQPHPRILPMLGEINLPQWQCVAELIDNALDPFITAGRQGGISYAPEVHINLPTHAGSGGKVTVRDNGPGLDVERLGNAVRAGWTGNDAIGNLGLFGMGFNIATARLGKVTKVWSTREQDAEWCGLIIDFDELQKQRHFHTTVMTRPKADPAEHGTEISIEKLKPDQIAWLARTQNRNRVIAHLERVYSSMLRPNGAPVSAKVFVNTHVLKGRQRCVWSGPASPVRVVDHPRYGQIEAYQEFDYKLADRSFCTRCWYWLPPNEQECAACGVADSVVVRQRRVNGWLGIQRYLDERDFGIDFIRHGRKIELSNKDLFSWDDSSGQELEYPIDDPRQRGRIVGEVHLDHARVTYTKDRFDRSDPAWDEMVHIVRSDGPLQPTKARQLGFGDNRSPLFLLYQAFRRSTPKTRGAGGYSRILVVPDNDRAKEMAERFHEDDPEYLSDEKWGELVEAADRTALSGGAATGQGSDVGGPEDFWEDEAPEEEGTVETDESGETEPAPPTRDPLTTLTREYRDEVTEQRWEVTGYSVRSSDPALGSSDYPWRLHRSSVGTFEFCVNLEHQVFQSATMTPLDALLAELAWWAMDWVREQNTDASFAQVLASLRERYATPSRLDPIMLTAEAASAVRAIARSVSRHVDAEDARALFQELSSSEQEEVVRKIVSLARADSGRIIEQGRFLEYAPRKALIGFVRSHPELFFDGRYWDVPFESLDLGVGRLTDEARQDVLERYASLLLDAVWLGDQQADDLSQAPRARIQRAALALELLDLDKVPGED
jgi:hypothetical protein